ILNALLSTIGAIVRPFPLGAARAFGNALGTLGWMVLARDRRKAHQHLAIAFPERTNRQRRLIVRDMFRHLGMSLMEFVWLPNVNAENLDRTPTIANLEPLIELVREGHGVIVFTGHCGNWEWLAYATSLLPAEGSVPHLERDAAGADLIII